MLGDLKITVNEKEAPWLECDGSSIPQTYSNLIRLIGNTTPVISYSEDSSTYIMAEGEYVPQPPSKGQLITMNLGNTGDVDIGLGTNTYRVMKTNNWQALCMAMYLSPTTAYGRIGTVDIGGKTVLKYDGSTIDTFLNTTWYNSLNSDAKSAIIPTEIQQESYTYSDTPNNHTQSTYTYQFEYNYRGEGVDDDNLNRNGIITVGNKNVFAPSIKDIYDYHGSSYIRSNDLVQLFFNKNSDTSTMLTRSVGNSFSKVMVIKFSSTYITTDVPDTAFNTRPMFTIDLNKIEWSKI